MLSKLTRPGLFITGTDTGVGKTVVAGAIADWFFRRNVEVGVFKPVATGCAKRREGLVSEDAEFLAHCADTPHSLEVVCPQRYLEPLAPAVAADRAGEPLEWPAIAASLQTIQSSSDVVIVEGVGGILVPLDKKFTVLDMAAWLSAPVVIVARPGLGTINHTLLTIQALRSASVPVAGVVINRYPTDSVGVAEETSPRVIEKFGKVPVLCMVPDEPFTPPKLPGGIIATINQVDWAALARGEKT